MDEALSASRSGRVMLVHEDRRVPRIVMVGAWNSLILNQAQWIGKYIFGYSEGDEVEITVLSEVRSGQSIALFPRGGFSYSDNKAAMYETSGIDLGVIVDAAKSLLENLPHTPISAIGINYKFAVPQRDALDEYFSTAEGLDGFGAIERQSYQTSIKDAEGKFTNIIRVVEQEGTYITVNFHHELDAEKALDLMRAEIVESYKSRAEEIVREAYDADFGEPIDFELQGRAE